MLRYFMGYTDAAFAPTSVPSGKRIRASSLLLAAEVFGGGRSAELLAAAVELFHNFTLIHDDIEDNDALRRGRPTVWKVWGVNHAINAGDAQALVVSDLLLKAAALDVSGAHAARFLNTHFLEVVEGQYLDFELTDRALQDPSVTTETYVEMIRKKTSVLVGAATAAGGISAGCDSRTIDLLFTYGESLGMAYQIADDMASVWGDEHDTGKRAHGDIFERKKTYPVLYARDHGADRMFLEAYGRSDPLDDAQVMDIIGLIDGVGAREATRALGESYVAAAKHAADELPLHTESRQLLIDLVDLLVRFTPDSHATD
jgi:geranylgeranyl diphosphate synthase type I